MRQLAFRQCGAACLRVIRLTVWLGALLGASSVWAEMTHLERAIDTYTTALETADRDLRLQQFARAEQLFRQVIEGDERAVPIRNAALYVNMGNAALQAERVGPAIAAYRRALALAPHNAQARQNLFYARSLLPDWVRREESIRLVDALFFWHATMSRGQSLMLGALCFLIASVLFAAGYVRRQPLLRNLAALPLLVWLILNISLVMSRDNDMDRNVVVVAETTVYTADSENSAPRLAKSLPSGSELSLLQQRERWSEVRLPDGRTGWVLTSTLDHL
ncbi:MAG: SH3 domain-containing protein [Pirellulaceae bacterium]